MEQQLLMAAEMDSAAMVRCVEECERCHRTCLRSAMTFCLEQGGEHAAPAHFRTMLACSDMCRSAIDALLSSFDAYEEVCALCARACIQCADSCDRVGDLQDCADACRRCASACMEVSGSPTRLT
ncbi:MAG TPA: four-helix bundle copper-binding protein [Steroidobacteraceae bacterium]|nr:four-helix bundle copper-binding protein [Steroidobacteraceae bacterium]